MSTKTKGSNLDGAVLEHFHKTGELPPSILSMSKDLIEELIGSAGFPLLLNKKLRDLYR